MKSSSIAVQHVEEAKLIYEKLQVEIEDFERERFEDVGFLTSMMLVILGNYAQTGTSSIVSAITNELRCLRAVASISRLIAPFAAMTRHTRCITGHFGGPLSYTPANVALHLAGPKNGGISYDIRHPKVRYSPHSTLAPSLLLQSCSPN